MDILAEIFSHFIDMMNFTHVDNKYSVIDW